MPQFIKKINTLDIEVTQKCNLDCFHCLRGKSRDIDMTYDILYKVSEQLKDVEIDTIQLMGGEPTLNPQIIYHIHDLFKYSNIACVSNGCKFSQLFCDNFFRCMSKIKQSKQEMNFQISRDSYHCLDLTNDIKIYEEYFKSHGYEKSYYVRIGNLDVINRGKLQPKSRKETYWDFEADNIYIKKYGNALHLDSLYITAMGDITLNCTHSFEFNEKHNWGNISNTDLHSMINFVEYLHLLYFDTYEEAFNYYTEELHTIAIGNSIVFLDFESEMLKRKKNKH